MRTERKTDSLPVLAELAAQEMRSYNQPAQTQSNVTSSLGTGQLNGAPVGILKDLQDAEEAQLDLDQRQLSFVKLQSKH